MVMTPQERQLVDELFDRLSNLENAPRDPDAVSAISQGLRKAPNAIYALVQTVLLQDEALRRANTRIEELEQQSQAPEQSRSGGFLDSMRDAVFGQGQSRGSVPSVPPPDQSRPVWNSGQGLQQGQAPGHYDQQGYGQGAPYGQPYGAPQQPFGGGGGSFLGTAAATAAGMVGGSLLLNSIRSMTGGRQQGIGDASSMADKSSPWSDQSSSDLARDAGVSDVGSSAHHGDSAGLFDQASNDDDSVFDESDDIGGDDGDGDYA
jgi:uncharacterized protein